MQSGECRFVGGMLTGLLCGGRRWFNDGVLMSNTLSGETHHGLSCGCLCAIFTGIQWGV